jgi:hypothetical protein
MAAHNWRALRERALSHGVANLMTDVPSMHIVLDSIEQIGLEAAVQGAKSQTEAKTKIDSYYGKLYRPDVVAKVINGKEYLEPPPGFSDEEIEASFDAFLAQTGR